jgi:N-methylhydantoinase B
MTEIDLVTLSTVWHSLQRVCREMRDSLIRSSTNILTTRLRDLGYGIWDADGRVVAIPEGFPCRLLGGAFWVKSVLRKFKGQIYPGDVFLTNDPFESGCAHLPDWAFIRPIFYKDKLTFIAAMSPHTLDNGGAQLGAYFLANDSIAEGLHIPPVKIVERGKPVTDVLDLILRNNRLPDFQRRENLALISCTRVAEQRITALLDKYGRKVVLASVEEMMNRTEKAVRTELAKWPDGTYYGEATLDDDGVVLDKRVTVKCKVTIKKGELIFDFSESDKQVKGYVNSTYPPTYSSTVATVFAFLDSALLEYHNEGSQRPITVIAPEGLVVNCSPGALVAAAPTLSSVVIESVLEALSQALPHRAIAPYGRLIARRAMGIHPKTGRYYMYNMFGPMGGTGAVYGYDGYQCACEISTFGAIAKADAEEEMDRFPWRVTRCEFITDSCGAGKWRGAPGIWYQNTNEDGDGTLNMGSCNGWRTPAKGTSGGHNTPLNRTYVIRNGEHSEITHPHIITRLISGDTVVSQSAGGAGVGNPEERDPEAVRMDVKNELVSLTMARDVYKVVLSPDTFEIDYKATQTLRRKEKN